MKPSNLLICLLGRSLLLHLLLTGSSLLFNHKSFSQVQSNAGYSQQVLPSKVIGPDAATLPATSRETLLTQFKEADDRAVFRTARVGLDRVRKYGVLTDGDFSKAFGKDGAAPTTGSLGLNYAVFLPVIYGRRYKIAPAGSPEGTEPIKEILFEEEPERLEPWLSINLLFSLGSRGDTLLIKPNLFNPNRPLNQRDFGQSLLLPGSASSSTLRSVTISSRLNPSSWWVKHALLRPLSFSTDLSISTVRWAYPAQPVSEFNLVSGSLRAYYRLFETSAKDADDFALQADGFLGLAFRNLRGDIREEPELIKQALGPQAKTRFAGYDVGIQASVNALRVTATYSTFGGNIKGFSHGQFIFGVGFSSAFRLSKTTRG